MILLSKRISRIKALLGLLIEKTVKKSTNSLPLHRMASFLLLTMMLPMVYTPSVSTENVVLDKKENNLKLSISSPNVVLAADKVSTIVPGESKIDREAREAREKAEAEARARAEAEARARADAAARQAAASRNRNVATRENRVYSDPSDFGQIYARAGSAYGVDPRLLRAVHLTETGGSGSTAVRSYAGAQGPMQFLPSTWRSYGVDGNGDGVADINNVEDAIFAAAKYLKACGYPDVKKALWGYNPSHAYYNKVTSKM